MRLSLPPRDRQVNNLVWEHQRGACASFPLLGLDVGDKRIGVALSDPTGMLATPLIVYHRRDTVTDVQYVVDLARDHDVVGVVMGLPKNMNGTEGPQAEKTREFATAVSAAGIPVHFWDERLSTVEATRRMVGQRPKRRGPQRHVDSEAAAIILETYLDFVRSKGGR